MSSLSLRLLEKCKVCLFKTTPLSLCQKKINAVHTATFYLSFVFLFFCLSQVNFVCLFVSHGSWTGTHILFPDLFILNFCAKGPLFKKKRDYIRAQISSLLHVYKCVYMHICVCMIICINWGGIYWPKTKVFTKSKTCLIRSGYTAMITTSGFF